MLLAGIGLVVAGILLLSNPGTATEARILSCDARVLRSGPARCRGIWSSAGRSVQGPVDGASPGDVGKRIDVRSAGDHASATRGRNWSAIAAFGAAAFCLILGGAMALSMRRPARPGAA